MAYIGKSPSGSGVRTRYYFTQTSGGGTSISGTDDNGKTLTYTDGEYMDVYLNGVLLVHGTDYGTGTANTISSLAALASGDVVEVVVYDIFNVAKINNEAVRKRYYKTASGSETSISGADDSGATITFPANAEIEVKLNGVALVQGTDYNTTSANTVGGLSALSAGQVVEVVVYERFVLGDTVSKADGGAFLNAVSIDNINIDGNTISSTDTNGDITLDPDGTGDVVVASGNLGVGTTSPGTRITAQTVATLDGTDGGAIELTVGGSSAGELFSSSSETVLSEYRSNKPLAFRTNNTERMRIDSSGDIGIGTASITNTSGYRNIHIDSPTSGVIMRMYANGTHVGQIQSASDQLQFNAITDISMVFKQNNTEVFRVHSDGHIRVGQTSVSTPGQGNQTVGGSFRNDGRVYLSAASAYSLGLNRNGDGELTNFSRQGVFKGSINISTSAVSYNTSSDHRLKENIADMTGAITRVKSLAPKRFNFIADDSVTVDGFLAHEAQTVVPEAVTGTHNEVDDDGNAVMQGIDQAKLVPLLTGALQEAIAKIETLEAKVTALENA